MAMMICSLFFNLTFASHPSFFDNFVKYSNNPVSNVTEGYWGDQSNPGSTGNSHLHPDVIYFPSGYGGYKFWCYYTPYPPDGAEDVCLVRSNDGINWTFDGTSNPIYDATTAGDSWSSALTADPDVIYVPEYGRWFLFFVGQESSGRQNLVLFTSTNGIYFYEYNGTVTWNNTDPVILSHADSGAGVWETKSREPTAYFDNNTKTFHLFWTGDYWGSNDNCYRVGYATFKWNESSGNIENMQRMNSSNPVYAPPATTSLDKGVGHINVVMFNNTLYMIALRYDTTNSTRVLTLSKCIDSSPPFLNWTFEGIILEPGTAGAWDDNYLYRSSIIQDCYGDIAEINENLTDDNVWFFYTGNDGSVSRFGLAFSNTTFPTGGNNGNSSNGLNFTDICGLSNGSTVYGGARWGNITSPTAEDIPGINNDSQIVEIDYYMVRVANDSTFTNPFINETGLNQWFNLTTQVTYSGLHYYNAGVRIKVRTE